MILGAKARARHRDDARNDEVKSNRWHHHAGEIRRNAAVKIEQKKRRKVEGLEGCFVLLFHSLKLLNSSSTAAPPAMMMPTQPTARSLHV